MVDLAHDGDWDAQWVWHPGFEIKPIQRCYFRLDFELSTQGTMKLHVSADSRYRLYVNGKLLGLGPAAGDKFHYHYDSFGFDRKINLPVGNHQLMVEVLSYGNNGPVNEMHYHPGFFIHGAVLDEQEAVLVELLTPGKWRVLKDLTFGVDRKGGAFTDTGKPCDSFWALAFTEVVDFNRMPQSPFSLPLADGHWQAVGPLFKVSRMSDPPDDFYSHWALVPSVIPQPELTPQTFDRVVRCTGPVAKQDWEALIFDAKPLTIAANTLVRVVLDQGQLTTAYPQISFKQGKKASMRMVYAEAFSKDCFKDVRDQPDGMHVEGDSDVVISAGNNGFYSPMRWATFRFLELHVQTQDQPLVISKFDSLFHAYPLVRKATFESDNPLANKLWDLSWHTLRLCCQDHFTDCPYYEQLQYMGDSIIQALVAYNVGGDVKLWHRLLNDMDHSRLPSGLTQSRYPSRHPQIIPTFSLIWIRAIQYYDQHVGDLEMIRQFFPGMTQVVGWFMQRYSKEGLFASLQWWQFVDWINFWPIGCGCKAVQRKGDNTIYPSSIVNLQLLDALDAMVQMGKDASIRASEVDYYQQCANELRKNLRKTMWCQKRGLYADSPNLDQFSEHANLLAIMTGTADERQAKLIVENLFTQTDEKFARSSMYFQFYFAQVMSKLGLTDRVWERLDQWQIFLDKH